MSDELKFKTARNLGLQMDAFAHMFWDRIRLDKDCESPIEEAMLTSGILLAMMCGYYVTLAANKEDAIKFANENRGLGFATQAPMGDYRVDIFVAVGNRSGRCKMLCVECDGHAFHERTSEQAARDRSRDRWFQSAGVPVLRFTGSEIFRDNIRCADELVAFVRKLTDELDAEG